jgi:hypothetical protein
VKINGENVRNVISIVWKDHTPVPQDRETDPNPAPSSGASAIYGCGPPFVQHRIKGGGARSHKPIFVML